jgi:hypothetical protein
VLARFAAGLLATQRFLLKRTIEHAIRHLDGRTSSGSSLLVPQQVQASLAEVAMDIREVGHLPDTPGSRHRAYQRLTAAGRLLLGLLGASGFLSDGPGADLHSIEVAGNVYLLGEGRS